MHMHTKRLAQVLNCIFPSDLQVNICSQIYQKEFRHWTSEGWGEVLKST